MIADYRRNGMRLPKWFVEKPFVPMGSEIIMRGYWELETCRHIGWGAGPIPWTAISDYCDAFGMVGDAREDFFILIRMLDNEHLKYNQEKLAEKQS